MLLSAQAGVVTHAQAREHGFSARQIEFRAESGKWRRIHRGIYTTFTGKPPREAQLWAALLWAGKGAMISHETAAELQGLAEEQSETIHVTVPSSRRPLGNPMPGVVIHRSNQSRCDGVAPLKLPRTRIEDTVLDLVATARTADDAYRWVSRAVADGKVSAEGLRRALDRRKRFPGRKWLSDVLAGHVE